MADNEENGGTRVEIPELARFKQMIGRLFWEARKHLRGHAKLDDFDGFVNRAEEALRLGQELVTVLGEDYPLSGGSRRTLIELLTIFESEALHVEISYFVKGLRTFVESEFFYSPDYVESLKRRTKELVERVNAALMRVSADSTGSYGSKLGHRLSAMLYSLDDYAKELDFHFFFLRMMGDTKNEIIRNLVREIQPEAASQASLLERLEDIAERWIGWRTPDGYFALKVPPIPNAEFHIGETVLTAAANDHLVQDDSGIEHIAAMLRAHATGRPAETCEVRMFHRARPDGSTAKSWFEVGPSRFLVVTNGIESDAVATWIHFDD